MTEFIFTATSITLLVLLAYAVEQLGNTYSSDYEQRRRALDTLDNYSEL